MIFKKWIFAILILLPLLAVAGNQSENGIQKLASKGTVALTFDDGPTEKYTPQILAILKKYNVKATFFMVGMNAEHHPDMVKAVLANGHSINEHSQTHPMLTKLNDQQLQWEVATPKAVINKIIGKNTACLRYPFGASNQHVRDVIRANGMVPLPMGFNSFDYNRPGKDKIVSWVLANAHSGQVFLFHDGFDKREQTVAALPLIIEGLKKKGYTFSQICVA
jgi:peptidoglycan/xylan/chitin deacetylase (PgdA/CDA1 family)